jgi:hypothetical protein
MPAKTDEMDFQEQKGSLVGPDPEETKVFKDQLEGNSNLAQIFCVLFSNRRKWEIIKNEQILFYS